MATRLDQAVLMAYLAERFLTWQKHRHLLSPDHSPLLWRKCTIYHVQLERIFNTVSTFTPYSIGEGGENENGKDKMRHRASIYHSDNFLHYDTILSDCDFWFCLLNVKTRAFPFHGKYEISVILPQGTKHYSPGVNKRCYKTLNKIFVESKN